MCGLPWIEIGKFVLIIYGLILLTIMMVRLVKQ